MIYRTLESLINDAYYEAPRIKKGSSQRKYENKNKNIEYYTDEKGNIRRRKLK